MEKFSEFCKEHKWAIVLVAFGLLMAILLMTIGFWKTLLLFAVVGLCFVIGYLLDKDGPDGVKSFFGNLFKTKKNP